jgi:hypothetical protein
MGDDKLCCGSVPAATYDAIVIALSFISIILTLVVVAIMTATAPSRDSVFRVAGVASAAQVVGGAGESGALYAYQLVFDWNENRIIYAVQKLENTTTDLTAIRIRGPILPFSNVGPLTGALCGFPTTACDVTDIPGVVQGTVQSTIYNGVILSGVDLRPVMEAYRAFPIVYYLELLSNAVPASPGAARGPLFMSSGFP